MPILNPVFNSKIQSSFHQIPKILLTPKRNYSWKMMCQPRTQVPDSEPVSERSYGIIPIRTASTVLSHENSPGRLSTANTQVLIIKQKTFLNSHQPFWSFPKGHPEHGDISEIHTAIREVKEETGIIVKEGGILFKDAEGLTERYRNPVRGWVKEVRYWVGLVEGQRDPEFELQETELVDARWVSWNEAIKLLTFEKGKEILKRVMELLDSTEQVKSGGLGSNFVAASKRLEKL